MDRNKLAIFATALLVLVTMGVGCDGRAIIREQVQPIPPMSVASLVELLPENVRIVSVNVIQKEDRFAEVVLAPSTRDASEIVSQYHTASLPMFEHLEKSLTGAKDRAPDEVKPAIETELNELRRLLDEIPDDPDEVMIRLLVVEGPRHAVQKFAAQSCCQ